MDIINNLTILWNAPKDWSATGGLVWFIGGILMIVVVTAVGALVEGPVRAND